MGGTESEDDGRCSPFGIIPFTRIQMPASSREASCAGRRPRELMMRKHTNLAGRSTAPKITWIRYMLTPKPCRSMTSP